MKEDLGFVHEFVAGSSTRTLLLLHGTGGNERDLIPLGRELDPAAALLSPRGKVLENVMPRFFRRLAEGVFDEEDIRRNASDLVEFITAAAREYRLDTAEIVAVGFSNGANIAAASLLLHGAVFRRAILLRPMVPLMPQELPDLSGVKVRVSAGEQDAIVSAEETQRLVRLLRNGGAAVAINFVRAGHGLTAEEVRSAGVWLRESR